MATLFRNSSPNALTREGAVALEKKRLADQRAARALAAQGRGNDTEVAHVSIGEIVLPKALQTQVVLNALRQAAAAAGIPLERLRIGSRVNSINPYTGMAEFYDGQAQSPMEEVVVQGNLITDDPSTNRKIQGLHPSQRYGAAKFINDVKDRTGQQLRIPYPSGYRTDAEQDGLYEQGRTKSGNIVTQARGGESYHNYGLGFDVVALNPDGKTISEKVDIGQFAPIAKEHGFAWGGDWAGEKRDPPHFQRTYGYTTDQLRQMREPGARYPTLPGQRNRGPNDKWRAGSAFR